MNEVKKNKIKILCIYQVLMHYRLPFYNQIAKDKDFDFLVIHGIGRKGTKLVNSNLDNVLFKHRNLFEVRIPQPFSPTLFFNLVREKPDIVFSEGASSLINGSIAFIYAKIFKKKFIWWSLGALKGKNYTGFRKLINKWENVIEKRADAIFTYSNQGMNHFISRGIKDSKIFVAVNVFDTSAKLKEIQESFVKDYISTENFNIGFIGTIQKTKNLELLISAVRILNKKYGNIHLHLVGDGEYLVALRKFVGAEKFVTFHGRMNYGSSRVLGNCSVLVLPGLGGLAICEGMLNSLAIITGNADGTEYDLVDERNGFIIEEMNESNLTEKIEFLYRNNEALRVMQKNSFEKITQELSFEKYYSTFKLMVDKTINVSSY